MCSFESKVFVHRTLESKVFVHRTHTDESYQKARECLVMYPIQKIYKLVDLFIVVLFLLRQNLDLFSLSDMAILC